jgi:hypothetical protein
MIKTMHSIYRQTVKPVSACTTIFTVYAKGYHDAVTDLQFNRPPSFTGILLGVTEGSLIGYFMGMTYPISIPIAIAYAIKTKN